MPLATVRVLSAPRVMPRRLLKVKVSLAVKLPPLSTNFPVVNATGARPKLASLDICKPPPDTVVTPV